MADQGRLRLEVLGPVRARIGNRELALGGAKQRALLGLLVTRPGRAYPTDELIDALWYDDPPPGAAVTIRTYVSRLREALGTDALISSTAAGYAIGIDVDDVDSLLFERLVREADERLRAGESSSARDRLTTALALWSGRPFAGLSDDGALRIEADRLDELRLHALEQRIATDIALARSGELIDEIETLVAANPYRERLWQLLMLALYHSGRQADALATYQRARRLLDEELGLEPGPELRALEGQILRHEIEPVGNSAKRTTLPHDRSTFVGRERELEDISRALERTRLVTVTGLGGVGKTRLAIEAARRARDTAVDGVVFVDLAPVAESSAVARAVARALDVREQPGRTLFDGIGAALRDGAVLICVDNCEQVLDAAAEVVSACLSAGPRVRIIATSRAPLRVEGENEVAIAPLAAPPPDAAPDALRANEAVRLLLERIAAAPDDTPDDALHEAGRICRDLDGLPLAIELAAARSKALSLTDIANRLDDRFRFLVSWRRVSAARHQTLRNAMDWSFDLLSAEEQQLFARLSVFVGGFDIEAATEVCAAGDEALAVELLGRLVDASLVIAQTDLARTRYRILETVRQYAATRLDQIGDGPASTKAAHATYFAALATRAEPELTSNTQTEWFARLDLDHDNLIAALTTLSSEPNESARLLEATVALTRFWYVRGHLAEAHEWLQRAVENSAGSEAPLRRRALTAAASISLLQGDYAASTRFGEESLAAARETGEQRLVANGLSNLGAILLAGGEHERSGQLLDEAVTLARNVGDSRILAMALNNLGDHALTQGAYERAEPLFAESYDLLRQRGDTANLARSLFNQGAVALRLGRTDDSERLLREALSTARETDDKEDTCWCLLGLAAIAAARGEVITAANLLGAATALLDAMGAAFKPFERTLHDDTEAALLEHSAWADYQAAREVGARMSVDEAVELATRA